MISTELPQAVFTWFITSPFHPQRILSSGHRFAACTLYRKSQTTNILAMSCRFFLINTRKMPETKNHEMNILLNGPIIWLVNKVYLDATNQCMCAYIYIYIYMFISHCHLILIIRCTQNSYFLRPKNKYV